MKTAIPLLVVSDIERSKKFYIEILNQTVTADFGANITFDGGFALQTLGSWRAFIDGAKVSFGGCDAELYFEEDAFDAFWEKLQSYPDIRVVHPVKTHAWGQRVVRFFDPDRHIIEVGEPLFRVAARFAAEGMDKEAIAKRMDIPDEVVEALLRQP
jgi:catechol 2,3-dioxygenase-like lactoylglutathione lyase family enzyme